MITIAIDGPAGSGKGTLARKLAAHYDFACLHTGLLYRALAKAILEKGIDDSDRKAVVVTARHVVEGMDITMLDEATLHRGKIGQKAAIFASDQQVRDLLTHLQRNFPQKAERAGKKGVILEGRDIGTVILPNADVKIYLTASLDERAHRRAHQSPYRQKHEQKRKEGEPNPKIIAEVKRTIHQRDLQDQNRAISPLKPAQNAHLLNTTKLSIDETFTHAVNIINPVLDRLNPERTEKGDS